MTVTVGGALYDVVMVGGWCVLTSGGWGDGTPTTDSPAVFFLSVLVVSVPGARTPASTTTTPADATTTTVDTAADAPTWWDVHRRRCPPGCSGLPPSAISGSDAFQCPVTLA